MRQTARTSCTDRCIIAAASARNHARTRSHSTHHITHTHTALRTAHQYAPPTHHIAHTHHRHNTAYQHERAHLVLPPWLKQRAAQLQRVERLHALPQPAASHLCQHLHLAVTGRQWGKHLNPAAAGRTCTCISTCTWQEQQVQAAVVGSTGKLGSRGRHHNPYHRPSSYTLTPGPHPTPYTLTHY